MDEELEEIDPADLGREILEIIRGYARRANASHERSDAGHERERN